MIKGDDKMKVVTTIDQLIGQTPLVKVQNILSNKANVYAKLEYFNPGASVKDRVARMMIEEAEKRGDLKEGGTIIEPTSGNTGIGLAMIAAAKGYRAVFVMPDTMSVERRRLLKAYGAEVVLTPGEDGMPASIQKARELAEENGWFLPLQFSNEDNPKAHYETTGPELKEALGTIDVFISSVGTGGTLTGTGRYLKEQFPNVKVVAVEPAESPVLSGGEPGPHKIQGIGAGFKPDILDESVYDEVIAIPGDEAYEYARRAAKEEGILCGMSSGAVLAAAEKMMPQLSKDANVVVLLPDSGERYLSTSLYDEE